MKRYNWPVSRIAAHSLFWPGFLLFVSGLLTGGIVGLDFPELWVPQLTAGGVLMVVGMGYGIKFQSWKSRQ